MDEQLKRRLVGAAIIIALAVIVVPFFFEDKAPKDASELPDAMDARPLVLPKQESAASDSAPASEKRTSAAPSKKRSYEVVSLDDPSKPANESPAEAAPKTAAVNESAEEPIADEEGEARMEEAPKPQAVKPVSPARAAAPKIAPAPVKPKAPAVVADEPQVAPKRVEAAPTKVRPIEPSSAAHKTAATTDVAPVVKKPQANTASPKGAVSVPPVAKPNGAQVQAPTKPVLASSGAQASQAAVYTVQAGTFNDETNASTLVEKLKKRNLPARLIAIEGPNGKVYRVTVGSKLDHGKAEQIQKQLAAQDGLKGLIMPTR